MQVLSVFMPDFQEQLHSVEQTEHWADLLAHVCTPGDCITLQGDLGAGKTTFARGFIRALAGEVTVSSPTFNLLQTYDVTLANGTQTRIWHYDLYRLKHEQELVELGLEEALESGIVLIEWPEIALGILPENCLALTLTECGNERRLLVADVPPAWYARLTSAAIIQIV